MKRQPPRQWQPGQSDNRKGRPKGSGEVAKLRDAIQEHVPAIIEKLTASALEGVDGQGRPGATQS